VASILLERSAEKDLGRLARGLHHRIIAAIKKLAHNPRPSGCRKLAERITTGAYASVIIM
jgi:mRNA-degrading endonuclease RelE of RelBE toxin-antitoxin system